jgi:hypothetical protein
MPWGCIALLCLTLGPAPGRAQTRDLVVVVRAEADARPLQNAEVIVAGTNDRRFTNVHGIAVLQIAPTARTFRVRQIGFAFRDLAIPAGDTVEVHLARIPFALPQVSTRATSACDGITPTDGALEAWALAQLREGAERYEAFRKTYPFDVTQIRRTVTAPRSKQERVRDVRERVSSARWGERYQRGMVVQEGPLGFSVPILFLATLGDSAFWDHHCAERAEVSTIDSARVVQLSFVPARHVGTTDWTGVAFLDSATSALRKVEFRLRVQGRAGPRRFEGYTTFRQPSPFIQVPDTTIAYWWRAAPAEGEEWGLPAVVQRVAVDTLRFKKEPP